MCHHYRREILTICEGNSEIYSCRNSGQTKFKRPLTIGELMRNQMKVSEAVDSRVRRALLRISAGQVVFLKCSFSL